MNTNTNHEGVKPVEPDPVFPDPGFVSFSDRKPDHSIRFHAAGNVEVGRLEWNDGVLRFSGNIEESAEVFLRYLAMLGGLGVDSSKPGVLAPAGG